MNKKGIALVVVLIILGIIMSLVTILYYSLNTDLRLNLNFKNYMQDFYLADSSAKIQDVKVISLSVSNISEPNVLEEGQATFPGTNKIYNYEIKYEFYKESIMPGTSLNMFNNYFYSVKTYSNKIGIKELVSKIGPKIH